MLSRKANEVKADLETYLTVEQRGHLAVEDSSDSCNLWLVKSPLEDYLGIQIFTNAGEICVGFVDLELKYAPRLELLKTMADLEAFKQEIDNKISIIF